MGKEVINEIRDNYKQYENLLRERKSIFDKVIEINEKGNNANIFEEKIDVDHLSETLKIELIVNVKVNNHKFFQFKLRCKDYVKVPFFRYDSDGETHRNYDDDIPLNEQSINTPHFHFYNEKGINIAYKTKELKNEEMAKALEDISLCISHYFHEANIRVNSDDFPEIIISSKSLGLDFTQIDPNSNVNFI